MSSSSSLLRNRGEATHGGFTGGADGRQRPEEHDCRSPSGGTVVAQHGGTAGWGRARLQWSGKGSAAGTKKVEAAAAGGGPGRRRGKASVEMDPAAATFEGRWTRWREADGVGVVVPCGSEADREDDGQQQATGVTGVPSGEAAGGSPDGEGPAALVDGGDEDGGSDSVETTAIGDEGQQAVDRWGKTVEGGGLR